MNRHRLHALLALFLIVPLWTACGDDATAPELDLMGLEPLELAADVLALIDPLRAVFQVRANIEDAIETVAPGDGVVVPPEHLGRTFAFNLFEDSWYIDESLQEAPAEAVRVIWYEVDSGGQFATPLNQWGHIDLTPLEAAGGSALRFQALFTAESPAITVVDFDQRFSEAGGAGVFEAFGRYSDGANAVDFDITIEEEDGGAYSLDVRLDDGSTDYRLEASGTEGAPGEDTVDELRATAVQGTDRTVLELTVAGSELAGSLARNGVVVALIESEGSSYEITTPDGDAVDQVQVSELNTMVRTMLYAGLEPVSRSSSLMLPLLLLPE